MKKLLLLLLLIGWRGEAQAQESGVQVIPSRYLHRPDSVAVFYPKQYSAARAWPLVYLLHGYGGNHRQWPRITDCQGLADSYGMVIVCPDGFDSWYLNAPSDSGLRMEDFFFNELVPFVHREARVDTANVFIAGLSMGGYGALRYFLRHPAYFNAAASSSGALLLEYNFLEKFSQAAFRNSSMSNVIARQLGLAHDEWPKEGIPHLLRQRGRAAGPFLMDCGRDDYFMPAQRRVQQVADSLKLPVTVISRPGNHNRAFWESGIGLYFAFFRSRLGQK